MKSKIMLLMLSFVIQLTAHAQEKSKYEPQLNALIKSFEKKDVKIIEKELAAGYTIGGMPEGLEAQVLPQVIPQFNGYTAYTILSEVKEKENTRVKITAKNPGKNCSVNMNFLFDKENRIKELNILESFNQ